MDIKIGQLWQSESDPEIIVKMMVILHLPESTIVIAKDRDTGLYYCEPETDWRTNWEMIPEKWKPKNPPPTEHRCCRTYATHTTGKWKDCTNLATYRYNLEYPGEKGWLCEQCAKSEYGEDWLSMRVKDSPTES